jgi:hypothetical protein
MKIVIKILCFLWEKKLLFTLVLSSCSTCFQRAEQTESRFSFKWWWCKVLHIGVLEMLEEEGVENWLYWRNEYRGLLWGASWCHNCKHWFPIFQSAIWWIISDFIQGLLKLLWKEMKSKIVARVVLPVILSGIPKLSKGMYNFNLLKSKITTACWF